MIKETHEEERCGRLRRFHLSRNDAEGETRISRINTNFSEQEEGASFFLMRTKWYEQLSGLKATKARF